MGVIKACLNSGGRLQNLSNSVETGVRYGESCDKNIFLVKALGEPKDFLDCIANIASVTSFASFCCYHHLKNHLVHLVVDGSI